MTVGPENFVTGQVEAAIPSVAVASNGTVGVFYYTLRRFLAGWLSNLLGHLAQSSDQGVTFSDQVLLTFLSSATDNGNNRQRVLGDYMQMKAVDTLLLRVLHRKRRCHSVGLSPTMTQSSSTSASRQPPIWQSPRPTSPDPVITGNDLTYTVTVTNNGPDPATSVTVTDNLPR